MLPALAGCNLYDSAVYGNRRGTVEQPGSGGTAGGPVGPAPGPSGSVQSEVLPPPPGSGSEPPASAAGSLPPPSAGPGTSGSPPPFGSQGVPPSSGPAPVPLPRGGGGGTQVAARTDPPAVSKPRFDWPVRGNVVRKYGPMSSGGHNNGIDIAAPSGAPVKAADGGTVVYVGNAVRGMGNLVLVSHPGGYVTAYGHTEQMLVKEGETVKRGQTIATVGRSGGSEKPQLHFEVHQAKKPVDPMTYLAQ